MLIFSHIMNKYINKTPSSKKDSLILKMVEVAEITEVSKTNKENMK